MKMKLGKSDEWYTPPEIFEALGVIFDLDPCSPGKQKCAVPAKTVFTKDNQGLIGNWKGRVWLNPPFGGRNGYFPWVKKFIEHGNGIGLITALTSSEGFQKFMPQMDALLFPKGKTRFIKENGEKGGCPFTGVVIFAIGKENVQALKNSNLGLFVEIKK